MRRLIILAAGALALSACVTTQPVVPGPNVIADKTVVDEQAGITVTLAYTAASRAAALAIQLADAAGHPLPAATVAHIGQLDARAYAAVQGVRQAYQAANSSAYGDAIAKANAAISDLTTAAKGH